MTNRGASHRSSGSGLFLLIVLTLAFLTVVVALSRLAFSSRVVGGVAQYTLGRQCLSLAESAVAEAMCEFKSRVNDPTGDGWLFGEIRKEVYAGDPKLGAFRVKSIAEPKEVERLLGQAAYKRFSLDAFSVDVIFQRPFDGTPYERFGTVRYRARVAAEGVARDVALEQDFKISLLTAPRPFDQATVYVHRPENLFEPANKALGKTRDFLEKIRSDRDEMVTRLQGESSSLGFDPQKQAQSWQALTLPDATLAKDFELPAVAFVLRKDGEDFDLSTIRTNLLEPSSELDDTVGSLSAQYDGKKSEFDANFRTDAAHEAAITYVTDTVQQILDKLRKVQQFRRDMLLYGGAGYQKMQTFTYKLRPSHWRNKASFVLDAADGDLSGQLATLRDRCATTQEGSGRKVLNGVVFIENQGPGKALTLANVDLPGKLVLVTTGNVSLQNVNAGAGPDDLLTVVCFGALSAEGTVTASLLPLAGKCTFASGTSVKGNVVFDHIAQPADLQGKVTERRRIYSGGAGSASASAGYPTYSYVGVSPRVMTQTLERR